MHIFNKRPLYIFVSSLIINGVLSSTLFAEPIYHPSSQKLTFGGMTHRRLTVSDMGNPAHPVINQNSERHSGGLSIGLGIEYDANDKLWELLDDAAAEDALDHGDDPDGGESGSDIPDINNPELEALIEEIKVKVSDVAVVLGVAMTDLNAKAFTSADIPILISKDTLGGAWTFNANVSLTTNLKGISDPITFDSDVALQTLQAAYDGAAISASPQAYDLSGGLNLKIDPDGSTSFTLDNNSGTITRAAQVSEYSVGYSRKIWNNESNEVYIGIEPKFYSVGLSNSFVFINNIDGAKSIFDALDKSSFKYTEEMSMDLGAIWTGSQYQLGATITNINEPQFTFPDIDLSGISNPDIVNAILSAQTYTMESQLKLEGGYISESGGWGINVGYDANAVPDPMLDDYQWLSVGAGFAFNNWWVPAARVGIRQNLVGTELAYVTAGITVFNVVNLDLATTTETIDVDGSDVPRGFMFNIGAEVLF